MANTTYSFFLSFQEALEVFYTRTSRGNRIACMFVRCSPNARYTILHSHGNAVDLGQMSSFYMGLGSRINCNIFRYVHKIIIQFKRIIVKCFKVFLRAWSRALDQTISWYFKISCPQRYFLKKNFLKYFLFNFLCFLNWPKLHLLVVFSV